MGGEQGLIGGTALRADQRAIELDEVGLDPQQAIEV
jgi:hypothetical protein